MRWALPVSMGLLGLAGSAAAQTGPVRVEAPPAVTGTCAVAPMTTERAIPVVEVTIQGKPYRFAIDTGAQGHGRIKAAVAEALGLDVVGEVGTPGPGGTVATRKVYGLPELAVGDMTFAGLQLLAMSDARGPDIPWDGILGISLFQQLSATFDYGNGRFMLDRTPMKDGVALTFDHGVPVLPVTIAGKRFPVHLDTGNSAGALFLSEAEAKALPFAGAPVERGRARTSFGEFAIMEAPLGAPVTVGDTALAVTAVGWPAARPPGNLGSKGLTGMVLTLDQRSARAVIAKSAVPPVCRQ